MATENFYSGNIYATDPVYKIKNPYFSPTGYQGNFSSISMALDPRTANQLKEVGETLNTGVKNIEVGNVDPGVFESIPKEHFKEMNRLAKLAGKGTELTFHAPMVDPTGITQNGWDEMTQKAAEKQLWSSLEKAHELNPEGNVVATFHATSVGLPPAETIIKDENGKLKTVSMLYINPSSGALGQIKAEKKYFGGKGEPIEFNPEKELKEINKDQWMRTMTNLNFSSQRGEQDIKNAITMMKAPFVDQTAAQLEKIKDTNPDAYKQATETKKAIDSEMEHGKLYLMEAYRNTKELYNNIYKNAKPEEKTNLQGYADEISPMVEKFKDLKSKEELSKFAETIEKGVKIMSEMEPEIVKPLRQFAVEKSAETTANLAWRGYEKFHENAPIIAIENHPAFQSVLTTGKDIKEVVDEAQKRFVEKAKSEGMSESDAKKQAEKLIGVTWDVGHINMMRRHGYAEKDIIAETGAIAKNVKKIHLADNFGYEHTELPMGMGNVPMDKIMEKIGKQGYDIKKVIEAGNWWQHFSGQGKAGGPLIPTLGGMGVPVYQGYNANWNQVYGVTGPYFAGYGTMLPDINFQTYGAGFSTLPMEFGGQMPGKDSKFSGTPMA